MAERIFLSYVLQDRDLVDAVEQALREHKIVTAKDVVIVDQERDAPERENVTASRKTRIGSVRAADIRAKIKDQISSASKVVIIASNAAALSPWVNYEAGMAAALGKPIVVIRKKGTGKNALIAALENVRFIEI
jgi:nucleoside 2-deoxyribosyltransferase